MKCLFVGTLALLCCPFALAQSRDWDGFVTDTHCGTHCQRTSTMTPNAECVRLCVRRGSKYGLWYGNHVYELKPQAKAADFAAKNVHIVGDLRGNILYITSIESPKAP